MPNQNELLQRLQEQLKQIMLKQETLQSDIIRLQTEIAQILNQESAISEPIKEAIPAAKIEPIQIPVQQAPIIQQTIQQPQTAANPTTPPPIKPKSDVEKFIGENLISKIGILLAIIGIGVGVKYAIDNNLMGPMMRILFGYACSAALLGTGVKLKKKYNNFSAVLFSGGIASAYFTTYFASVLYGFIPREAAFGIMALMTVGVVFAAIWYGREVIAHIGLWGAYAVPVLLGDGSHRVEILYSYMLLINVGMLVISVRQNWKLIFLNAFISSWLIYIFASFTDFNHGSKAQTDLLFATAFFLLFYIFSVIREALKKEKMVDVEIVVVILNAIIYLVIGNILAYRIADNRDHNAIFIFANALIYLITSLVFYFRKSSDTMFRTIFVLGTLSLAAAIPVQFEGIEIILLWSLIILALHLLTRFTKLSFFENISIPIYVFVIMGAFTFWGINIYKVSYSWDLFMRTDFLWSSLFVASIGASYLVQKNKEQAENPKTGLLYFTGTIFVLMLYSHFLTEIISYFRMSYIQSIPVLQIVQEKLPYSEYVVRDKTIIHFGIIYSIVYSILFLVGMALLNIYYFKKKTQFLAQQYLFGLITLLALTLGLTVLYKLDTSYIWPYNQEYYPPSKTWISLRYVLFASLACMMMAQWLYIRKGFIGKDYKAVLGLLFHFILLIIISHEMLHWAFIHEIKKVDKYGLSVFWGLYSLFLVGYGIWKNSKSFRISGMVVLGITLIKLFVYDTPNLGMGTKGLLFLALAGVMLLISFLYNKYKNIINSEEETKGHSDSGQ